MPTSRIVAAVIASSDVFAAMTALDAGNIIARRAITNSLVLTTADRPIQHVVSSADANVTMPNGSGAPWGFTIKNAQGTYNLNINHSNGAAIDSVSPVVPWADAVVEWNGTNIV